MPQFSSLVHRLSKALAETEGYRTAYESALQEAQGLADRNALAEDEAAHLSQLNAEILGHSNPAQKIMYVDKLRKELAVTKQASVQAC